MSEHLNEQQERIILKIGKMMLNLQLFERKLKSLLAARELQGREEDLPAISQERHASYAKTMLGLLAGELTKKAIRPDDDDEDECEIPPDHYRISLTFNLAPAEIEEFKQQLKSLVDDRNNLIHKFTEMFSLRDPDQLDAAEQFIDALRAKFIPLNEIVDQWVSMLPAAFKAIDEALQNAPENPVSS